MSNKFTSDEIVNKDDSDKKIANDNNFNQFKRKTIRNKFGYFINDDERDENKMSSSDKEESDNYYGQFSPGKETKVINNDIKDNISDEKEKYKNYIINNREELHNEDILISTERNDIQIKEMNIKFMENYFKEKIDKQNENKSKCKNILINENNIIKDTLNEESDEEYYIMEREFNKSKYDFKNNNKQKIKIKQIPNFYDKINKNISPPIRKIYNSKYKIEDRTPNNSLYHLNCNQNSKIYRKKNPNRNIHKKNKENKTNPSTKKKKIINNNDKYCLTPPKRKQKYIILKREIIRNKSKDNNNNNENCIYIKSKQKKVSTPNRLYSDKRLNKDFKKVYYDPYSQKLEKLINKYSLNEELSIINMIKCLYDLRIINELINKSDKNNNLNIEKIKEIINNIKENDLRKKEELQFLEQLWFILNPSMNNYINNKLFLEFLRIILTVNNKFTNNDKIKQLSTEIENLLNEYIVNDEAKRDNELVISPLTNKAYSKNDIWPIQKLIKVFLKINRLKGDESDLTFKPNLNETYIYFKKYSKYNYYNNTEEDSSQSKYIKGKKKQDFDIIYQKFMKEKILHEKTLEKLREIKLAKELRNCSHSPKINRNYPMYAVRLNRTFEDERNVPVYERLYNMRKNSDGNGHRNSKSEIFDFKPILESSNEIMNRNFNNNKKPKGYKEYVRRNRAAIDEKEKQRKIIEDKTYGKNYEKICDMKKKPLNIRYLTKDKEKNNINDKSKSKEKNKIINNIFVTIEIKINNGQLKPFKIYKNQNNTEETVDNFCKMFNINEEDKKEIYNQVIHYKNVFFGEKNSDSNIKKETETSDTYDNEHCINEI